MRFSIIEKKTGKFPDSILLMMKKSGLDAENEFEDFGIQSDGTAIIFDKVGNFAYLSDEYKLTQEIGAYVNKKWEWEKVE